MWKELSRRLDRGVRRAYQRLAKRLRRPSRASRTGGEAVCLHLGCGQVRLEGYCNIDIVETAATDTVCDIASLAVISDESVAEIYACHVLEHFSHADAKKVIRRWYDVLAPGGLLRLSVPDLDRIVAIYAKNQAHFRTPGNTPWIGLIYGGQGDEHDFHKTGFNLCWMTYILEEIGFEDVREYPHEPHFIPGARDASLAREPFGEFLSLNVLARKPL